MCDVRAAAAHQAVQAAGPMWRKEWSGFRHIGKSIGEVRATLLTFSKENRT